jgi:cobalt/nickel transport system ATP-binding protein
MLSTQDVSYCYGDGTLALSNVSMTFITGKTTAVLGANGAGKSTLFKLLLGIDKPTSGQVFMDKEVLCYTKSGLERLRTRVGLVFQDPDDQLFSASVREDIAFGPLNLGLSQDRVLKRVDWAMKIMEIEDLSMKPTHHLSFGQKKRVAIAGILAMEPQVLILDEPTAGLDPKSVSELMNTLDKLQKQTHITVILATHDIDLVPLYADWVYILQDGQLISQGQPSAVFSQGKSLRRVGLRLPRIAHLMEILIEKDHIELDTMSCTISGARRILLKYIKGLSG